MVLLASLMEFSWVDRSFASLWIELKGDNSRHSFARYKNPYLSEVICGGEPETVVRNSYLFRV